jgi:DNA-binding XRE family transcriptional regulator
MSRDLTNTQKREWAEMLYMQNQLSQKEIAIKVGVNEKSITTWKEKYCWEQMRKSLLTTKSEILRFLYSVLDKVKTKIEGEDGIGDTKMADMVVKYTSSIKSLETETSIAQMMEAGMKAHKYFQSIDPAFALQFLNNYDGFIKESLKKF